MNLPVEVIEAVRQGRCVLFMGSRASLEAAELADAPYPDAAELAKRLGWKKPPPVPGSKPAKGLLPSVEEGAQAYEDKNGRPKLLASLTEWIGHPPGPTSAHRSALARFPLIFTTAVDDLFEQVGSGCHTKAAVEALKATKVNGRRAMGLPERLPTCIGAGLQQIVA